MKIVYHNKIAIIDEDTHISECVRKANKLDWNVNHYALKEYINPGDCVIDIGAMIGDDTIMLCNWVGKDGVVMAFEPNHISYECLCRNVPNALNFRVALSDRSGLVKMTHDKNVGGCYAQEATSGYNDMYIMASTIRLDDLHFSKLNFIKMDVEGFELKVLRGGDKTITKHKPVMFLELNEWHMRRNGYSRHDIFDWMTTHGYEYNIWNKNDDILSSELCDIICKPIL